MIISQTEFAKKYESGKSQLVYRKLIADLETPVSAFLKLYKEGEPIALLESVQGGEVRGRYSIIALNPDKILRFNGEECEIEAFANGASEKQVEKGNPLKILQQQIDLAALEIPAALPPMASGLFGFISYDSVRFMEKLPDAGNKKIDIADAVFMRPKAVVVFDSVADEITLVALADFEKGKAAEQKYQRSCGRD